MIDPEELTGSSDNTDVVRKPWEAAEEPTASQVVSAGRFAVGALLAGRYRVDCLLGRGGMGEVYRAEDTKLGEAVALKILPGGSTDPAGVRLLLGEVRVARQISHPNVCRVHDVGESGGLHFMTMELIEGEDLAALLSRTPNLPIERAIELGRQVCEGLAAAHDRGILHRDLKPGNLMIDATGNVRLADFGLAGLIGSENLGGTPGYMAPELHDGADPTVQSDLYALGMVLYILVTGRRPFGGRTRAETVREHREVVPKAPSELRPGLAPAVERAIQRCLEKDPRRRPRSARAVAAALTGRELPTQAGGGDVSLRDVAPPELPAHPYPVLLPYQHPELLAGRERDVARLERLLRTPVPILGLSAPSGSGKSSLLLAGVVPRLRADGRAVALERHPAEPGLAGRLVHDLLEVATEGGISVADRDANGFVALLAECESLSKGKPPILVVDQLEDLLIRPGAGRARATLGLLLAATCRRRPGSSGPPCRWLLAYRAEYHGDVVAWLADATADARREGVPGLDALPHDLAGAERFQATSLPPLGTPGAGSRDPLEESTAIFKAAIEAPLALTVYGVPRYRWRFAEGGADRLARAFAEARLERPDAPLAPELQVVLAHLLSASGGAGVVDVPAEPGELVDRALDDHLRRALEAAFPAGPGAARNRSRALLALRELAGDHGARKEGRPATEVERAVGTGERDGRSILERLAAPDARLVVRVVGGGGEPRWALSHDRMALAIARLVDEEGRGGGLALDAGLLDLRRLVAVKTELHHKGEASATELPGRRHRQIAACADALLWDDERRAWWAACRKRRGADLLRRTAAAFVAVLVVASIGVGLAGAAGRKAARAALLDQLVKGEPEAVLRAAVRGLDDPAVGAGAVRERLRSRARPLDLLEAGLSAVPEKSRGETVLRLAELVLPLLADAPADAPADDRRLATFLWALDYGPGRVPVEAERAARLRESVLAPLRKLRPPPEVGGAGWVRVSAGTFAMGKSDRDDDGERVVRDVTVSAFRALDHEVTNAEYRRFRPDQRGDDDLPVVRVDWYAAYVYSAWLGGRLPTEAEWEYMAKAGCAARACRRDGSEAPLGDVAWTIGSSVTAAGELAPHPVRRREPNPWGLYDVLGNVAEWTADWHEHLHPGAQVDPWGPPGGEDRMFRGSSFRYEAARARAAQRYYVPPGRTGEDVGFRPVIPGG